MQVRRIAIAVFIFLNSYSVFGQWVQQNSNTNNELLTVCFPSKDTGFAGGWHVFLKTYNGGTTWIADTLGQPDYIFNEIQFLNNNTGYVTANGGVFKTTNAGETWENITPSGGIQFDCISFLNKDTGFVGALSHIYGTFDGGNNWYLKYGLGMSVLALQAITVDSLFMVGKMSSGIARVSFSFDNSDNWDSRKIIGYSHDEYVKKQFYFSNTQQGNMTDMYFMTTDDNGFNWNYISYIDAGATTNPDCFYFINLDTVFMAGYGGLVDGYLISKSFDRGQHWVRTVITDTFQGGFSDISMLDTDTGYVVGAYGVILKTTNGGGIYNGVKNINSKNSLTLSPNPTTSTVTLQLPNNEAEKTITVLDLNGKIVQSIKLKVQSSSVTLDLSALPSGMYFINARTYKGVYNGKVVKE